MNLTRINIAAFLLVFGVCNIGNEAIKVNDSNLDEIKSFLIDDADVVSTENENEENAEDNSNEELPILPPIILLNFDNDTSDDNATAEEKSKRTVNNGLGYGFDQTSSRPRKYSYYFPAGKTRTVVSLEESISPYLPKTIIEKAQLTSRKPVSNSFGNIKQQGLQGTTQSSIRVASSEQNFQGHSNYQYYDPPEVFGLRMKSTKTSTSEPFRGFIPTTRPTVETILNYKNVVSTTPNSLIYNPIESTSYVTPTPQTYTTSSRFSYITPTRPTYSTTLHSQKYLGLNKQHVISLPSYARPPPSVITPSTPSPFDTTSFVANVGVPTRINPHGYVLSDSSLAESSTSRPFNIPGYEDSLAQFANLPRFTVENGIKYENKIFWKYPDGRLSATPPAPYETYSYPSYAGLQFNKNQNAPPIYETPISIQNVALSQGPAQFPIPSETDEHRSPFVSAGSLSNNLSQQQSYRLGYQNLIGQKQSIPQYSRIGNGYSTTVFPTSSTTPIPPKNYFGKVNYRNPNSRYDVTVRPTSKYMITSPNTEYNGGYYTTESPLRKTTPTNPYVSLANENLIKKFGISNKNLDYSNLQYSDLLNFNPSISQYIKNPASILNVQPTFVQTGNSLVPVIILRVDGIPPIQPKATPNVNLKALLQQYLIQYANSIAELTRSSDIGYDQSAKEKNPFSISTLRELARLAQQGDRDSINGYPDSYKGKSSYTASNLDNEKHTSNEKYGDHAIVRPKVKSVQIIENGPKVLRSVISKKS